MRHSTLPTALLRPPTRAGDTLVIADANFPAASVASKTPGGLINCDGNDAPTILKAVMGLLPLDPTCPPCQLMQLMPEHKAAGWKTPIWSTYKEIIDTAEGRDVEFVEVERFAFYEEAKKAYAVVTTGEVRSRDPTCGCRCAGEASCTPMPHVRRRRVARCPCLLLLLLPADRVLRQHHPQEGHHRRHGVVRGWRCKGRRGHQGRIITVVGLPLDLPCRFPLPPAVCSN